MAMRGGGAVELTLSECQRQTIVMLQDELMADLSKPTVSPPALAALAAAAGSAATVLGAYYFEHVLNIPPCPLCLEQRTVHYIAISLALVVAFAAFRKAPPMLVRAGLAALALAFVLGAGMGGYHAGVEWGWWPGPQECSGPLTGFGNAGDLLRQMQTTSLVRCDEVLWRFLGLSLAGYNAVISLALAAVAVWGLVAARRPFQAGL
jgi:disulfide bond formation protein DsbB